VDINLQYRHQFLAGIDEDQQYDVQIEFEVVIVIGPVIAIVIIFLIVSVVWLISTSQSIVVFEQHSISLK
jgi:uncharacterized membrane protein YdbT with pleckstrin-like domain